MLHHQQAGRELDGQRSLCTAVVRAVAAVVIDGVRIETRENVCVRDRQMIRRDERSWMDTHEGHDCQWMGFKKKGLRVSV